MRQNNILLKENRAYICDFGTSSILDGVRGLTTDAHGNIRWKSPEQLDQEASLKVTVYCDMYSYGSIFLEVNRPQMNDCPVSDSVVGIDRTASMDEHWTEEWCCGIFSHAEPYGRRETTCWDWEWRALGIYLAMLEAGAYIKTDSKSCISSHECFY